ncbi:hypothetical protein BH23VER1_BH23VER1_17580 [soil metagenome]
MEKWGSIEITVFRRADGEYIVFIEDDGYTKNVVYRWKP